MIRSIQSISDFAIFSSFRWPTDLPEFKKRNLLYGWNYSGKTTLSRIFRCFEQKQQHPDFRSAQVQLRTDDGTLHDLSNPLSAPPIRVFNSDFIRDNLSFETGTAAPILVLGAEDISKREKLKQKRAEYESLLETLESSRKSQQEKQSGIDKALTNDARNLIKNPLSVPGYDKRPFEARVIECQSDPEKHILSEDTFSEVLSVYRSTDKKPALLKKVARLSSVAQFKTEVAELLSTVVAANNPILRLKQNPGIERWVDQGRQLHAQQTTCQFCGQILPPDLLSRFREHFSAEYDGLMAGLRALAAELRNAGEESVALDHKADFYDEFTQRFSEEKTRLEDLLSARKAGLRTLVNALDVKQTKAFANVDCPEVQDPGSAIDSAIDAINEITAKHNNRTAAFEQRRADAFGKLERHYAASFVRDQEYDKVLGEIQRLTAAIPQQTGQLAELDAEIHRLEGALSQDAIGAQQLNELLSAYFGKADLRIDVTADRRFQITRSDVAAKNLSEGEKTAIAFAYFIIRVHDGRLPLSETVVVIDDPISSLDTNHLFNTYALVKTRLADCHQLFVFTHSFEFYNLLREWVLEDEKKWREKPQSEWKTWGMVHIRRVSCDSAVIEEIPKELLKFKSEYHYLFSKLYRFDSTPCDLDALLSLPNVVRRFMEAFGGIMIPLSTGLHKKMERLFPEDVVRERVWKFINHYSHNTSVTRSLTVPDMSECKAVVEACLNAVRSWDDQYFRDLECEVGVSVRENEDELARIPALVAVPT